jgi:hypothetical protein
MLAITTASATSFAPAATLNPVKSAALLITQLDTVGFDARRAQSKIKGVEQSISAPLRAVSRQADRLAARVCMTLSADNMQEPVAVPEPPPPPPKIQTLRVGDKALAGDFGFDPLGLADEPKKLAWYREAEIKHARLAMLAAAGWPLSEKLNLNPDLLVNGRAPSLLNGGLGNINTLYWVAALGLAVFVESKSIDSQLDTGKRSDDYLPGMMGFDPLGQDSPFMRNAEIMNGRVAMVAITAYALEEAITKAPVVVNTPFLFNGPF